VAALVAVQPFQGVGVAATQVGLCGVCLGLVMAARVSLLHPFVPPPSWFYYHHYHHSHHTTHPHTHPHPHPHPHTPNPPPPAPHGQRVGAKGRPPHHSLARCRHPGRPGQHSQWAGRVADQAAVGCGARRRGQGGTWEGGGGGKQARAAVFIFEGGAGGLSVARRAWFLCGLSCPFLLQTPSLAQSHS